MSKQLIRKWSMFTQKNWRVKSRFGDDYCITWQSWMVLGIEVSWGRKKCLHAVGLKVMQMLNSVRKQKNQNTSPYLIDKNKGDVVMRESGFMNNSSETKARILLAELFIKPLKTARCQSKRMVFEIVKETLPLSRSLFTLNATKQLLYAEISKHLLILLQGEVISLGGKVCHSSFEFYWSVLASCESSTESTKRAVDHRIKQREDHYVQERRPGWQFLYFKGIFNTIIFSKLQEYIYIFFSFNRS